jgi:hypothetical protein
LKPLLYSSMRHRGSCCAAVADGLAVAYPLSPRTIEYDVDRLAIELGWLRILSRA